MPGPWSLKDARMFSEINYLDVLSRDLGVMDFTAISMCRDNNMPIVIFNINTPGNMRRIVLGEKVGSLVTQLEATPS